MYDEDDDEDLGTAPTPRPASGGLSQAAGYSIGRGDPALREEAIKARSAASQSQSEYMAAMDAAIQRAIQRRTGPSESERSLRMAAALGRPTRTGSFGETMGNVAEGLAEGESSGRREGVERDNAVEQLRLAIGKGSADYRQRDAQLASNTYLRDRPRVPDRVAMIQAWSEAPEGSPLRAELRSAIDADLARAKGRPPAAPRDPQLLQLARAAEDPNRTPAEREAARRAVARLDEKRPTGGGGGAGGRKVLTKKVMADGTTIVTYDDETSAVIPPPEGYVPPKAPMSAGDRKAIRDAEDEVPVFNSSLSAIDEAIKLVPKAYHGPGAAAFGKAGTAAAEAPLLGRLVNGDQAKATKRLLQLLDEQAISAMSATLTGATTNFELGEFKSILSDPSSPEKDKLRVLTRMQTLFNEKKKIAQRRTTELREGSYYNPGAAGDKPPADRPPADLSKLPKPKSREERDALPKGSWYVAPDGEPTQRK